MDRQALERDMKSSIGAFPNISQLARYMGWGRDRTRAFCKGLPKVGNQMFYKDIANRLIEEARNG